MKTINGIVTLIERAKARAEKSEDWTGYAVQNRRERHYNWGGPDFVGDMKEVYRVEYIKGNMTGDVVNLFHYETHTAEVWVASDAVEMHVYGESRSDADSINTFFEYFGIAKRYTFRPVNGGFQEVK